MKNALVHVTGFLGDILFASSVAEPLKKKYDHVRFVFRFLAPYELIKNNPFIDSAFVMQETPTIADGWDVFTLGEVNQSIPVTIQFQQKCGIENPTLGYTVYTNESYDILAKNYVEDVKTTTRKKVIAVQSNWEERTFGFTPEEYKRGIDIPPLGYGGRRRRILDILNALSKKYSLIEVGLPAGTRNGSLGLFDTPTYSMTASIIKHCDWMIGGEGGLTNLAAGVGTKTVITGDFIHQLYGWNGCLKKFIEPKMGPKTYFPDAGHVTLDPFLTDDEVVNQITEIIG